MINAHDSCEPDTVDYKIALYWSDQNLTLRSIVDGLRYELELRYQRLKKILNYFAI